MLNKVKNLANAYGVGGIKKSLHLAVSQSFVAILFIGIDFIFSKQLSVAEFGIWKEVFFIFNLGIPLLAFGLPEGFKFFIAKRENDFSFFFQNVTASLLKIAFTVFVIIGILNLLHYFNVFSLGPYYLLSLLFPIPLLAFLFNKVLRYSYINLNQAEKLTKLSIYGALCSLGIVLLGWLFLTKYPEEYALVAVFTYMAVFLFPALFYMKDLTFIRQPQDNAIVARKKMYRYGLPLYFATFAGLLSVYLDKFIVNIFEDETVFAIFAVGAFEIPIFAMLSAAFSQQIFPVMVRHIEDDNEDKAKELWLQTTKKVSLITYPFILITMFFAEDIIFFIYSEAYEASVILFKTYLLIALFRNNSYGILLTAKGHTKLITKISIAILSINIIASLLLYNYIGIQGIIYGTLLSAIGMNFTYLIREKIFFKFILLFGRNWFLSLLIILIIVLYFYR